jgi:hypothetical protein
MNSESKPACECGKDASTSDAAKPAPEMFPIYREPVASGACCAPGDEAGHATDPDEPCCGPPSGPPSSPDERPGYAICHFVEGFIDTPSGRVPRVTTALNFRDRLGTLSVRLSLGRDRYKVAPGLYALGLPDPDSPVLVTANYKLSFDHLRRYLKDRNLWVLVLDTRGINVWCAAGKGTFGTAELVRQVRYTGLAGVVRHRKLVLPQLGATGVAAADVKRECGFEVVWGPILAADIPAFIDAGFKATEAMRRVTFTLKERMVLVPVELFIIRKTLLWTMLGLFIVSGVGRHVFSLAAAWQRGLLALTACLAGVIAGCVVAPLLLPWLPGRAFAIKGAVTGFAAGLLLLVLLWANPYLALLSATALMLAATAISSFLAMNFTGSTPFTSPSGVEKEMRCAIPLQLGAALLSAGLWLGAGFIS